MVRRQMVFKTASDILKTIILVQIFDTCITFQDNELIFSLSGSIYVKHKTVLFKINYYKKFQTFFESYMRI